jgi:hypothetical protein
MTRLHREASPTFSRASRRVPRFDQTEARQLDARQAGLRPCRAHGQVALFAERPGSLEALNCSELFSSCVSRNASPNTIAFCPVICKPTNLWAS